MALSLVRRKIHIKHSQLLSAMLFNSAPSLPSISFRTFVDQFQPKCLLCPFISHFSHSLSFSARNVKDPVGLHERKFNLGEEKYPGLLQFLQLLREAANFPSETEASAFMEEADIRPNDCLIQSAMWELRQEWKLAFFAFKWGERHNCIDEIVCNLMIWILGNHQKFNTAWCLISNMHQASMCTRQALLTMIDRYASLNNPAKAIETFYIMEKFRLTPDQEAFHSLLNSLCKHGNIEEAEELLLVNNKLFPLETESFNIILNGWCNIVVYVSEAKRVWREMSKRCITPNATSYTYMISCFSKVGNLFDSLRLYDEMTKRNWVPGILVYNSLMYVLTRENCLKEALKIIDKLKEEGLKPDSTTYNSIICPLCEAKRLEEARVILKTMIEEDLSPTMETYHAFLEGTDYQGTLEVITKMRKAGLRPSQETLFITLKKKLNLEQPVNALRIWTELKECGVEPSSRHYTLMVEGLARCKWLTKAREFYDEMILNGHVGDPKLKKLLLESLHDGDEHQREQLRNVEKVRRQNQVRNTKQKKHQGQSRDI